MHAKVLVVGAAASKDAVRALHGIACAPLLAADSPRAFERLSEDGFDIVVIGTLASDVRADLCAAIRSRWPDLPILLLGASEREAEAIGGLSGPGDYVVREFDANEIRIRARSLIRRARANRLTARADAEIESGPLRLDPSSRRVAHAQRTADLTAIEYRLLWHLARAPGRTATRRELLRVVWGYEHEGYAQTLTTHMNRLRTKLSQLGAPRLIETVRGLGYRYRFTLPLLTAMTEALRTVPVPPL